MTWLLDYSYRRFLQPKAMLAWAVAITVAFAIVHALGWREFTTVLSGTIPKGASGLEAGLKAMAYLATYFACVLVAPVLVIAAGISFGLERALRIWRGAR